MNKYLLKAFLVISAIQLYSQTSGVTQPDFMKYSQIETGAKVNEFDGSFNFSIPVVSIPSGDKIGYTLQLTYQSGTKPNDEATWVGYGWSLNPGAIVRQVKGFPDDFDGVKVEIVNNLKPDISKNYYYSLNLELFSVDKMQGKEGPPSPDKPWYEGKGVGLSGNYITTYSNNNGFFYSTGGGVSASKANDLGNQVLGGINVQKDNLGNSYYNVSLSNDLIFNQGLGLVCESCVNEFTSKWYGEMSSNLLMIASNNLVNNNAFLTPLNYGKGIIPTYIPNYAGSTVIWNAKLDLELFGWLGMETTVPGLGINCGLTKNQYDMGVKEMKAYGFMYSGKGYRIGNSKTTMLDYYSEKDPGLSGNTKNLPIPFSNNDNFIVTGQGLAGSFKLYSKKPGLFKPREIQSGNAISDNNPTLGYNSTQQQLLVGFDGRYGENKSKLTGMWAENDSKILKLNENIKGKHYQNDENNFHFPYSFFQEHQQTYDKRVLERYDEAENYFFKFSYELSKSNLFGAITPFTTGEQFKQFFSPIEFNISEDVVNFKNIDNHFTRINGGSKINKVNYIESNISISNLYDKFNSSIACPYNNLNYSGLNLNGIQSNNMSTLEEFKITKDDGSAYFYSIPVYNMNEENASINLDDVPIYSTNQTTSAFTLDGQIIKNLPYTFEDNFNKSGSLGSGKRVSQKYAGTYLITKVLSNDYVDLTSNGPTIDDAGDYVLFHYRKATTSYKWREPYKGLLYDKGANSDFQDDKVSYSSGEKEIYYLESIETKTHIALFITNNFDLTKTKYAYGTKNYFADMGIEVSDEFEMSVLKGSGRKRKDAYPAFTNTKESSKGIHDYPTDNDENILEYLEKIVLFEKDQSRFFDNPPGANDNREIKLLKTRLQVTNLGYDQQYPLWTGMENSSKPANNSNRSGKLTLKEMWIDNGRVLNDKVSKYIFNYIYPNSTGYNLIDNYMSSSTQTPSYSRFNIDKWDHYSDNITGFTSYATNPLAYNVNYNKQRFSNTNTFDPSAYQLKHIILPNGLETVVQYEPKDYSFVQNRNAHLMYKIDSYNKNEKEIRFTVDETYCSTSISNRLVSNTLSDNDLNDYVNFLNRKLKDSVAYFKFYYEVYDLGATNEPTKCSNEFVEGYVRVRNFTKNNREIIIQLHDEVPYSKCKDFFLKRRNGLMNGNEKIGSKNCEPCIGTDPVQHKIYKIEGDLELIGNNYEDNKICTEIFSNLSFVRLPLMENMPKLGDGVRVKRLINIDKFDNLSENLSFNNGIKFYGSEYIYGDIIKNANSSTYISSGVATNEPQKNYEECPLKTLIERQNMAEQDGLSTDIGSSIGASFKNNAENNIEIEGPFCESILPAPEVNYAKVYTVSLEHLNSSSNTAVRNDNNIVVKEYNTVKDFPFDGKIVLSKGIPNSSSNLSHTITANTFNNITTELEDRAFDIGVLTNQGLKNAMSIGKKLLVEEKGELLDWVPIGGFEIREEKYSFSQGYQYIVHNMHGKPKIEASYSSHDFFNKNTWIEGTKTEYDYYDIGQAVPIIENLQDYEFNINELKYDWLGMMEEYANESRELSNSLYKFNGDFDFRIDIKVPPYVYPQGSIGYQDIIDRHRYFVSNRVISLPVIQKSVKQSTRGMQKIIQNIAYDAETGQTLVTKTSDVYSKSEAGELNNEYINFSYNSKIYYNQDDLKDEKQPLQINSFIKFENNNYLPVDNTHNQFNLKLLSYSNKYYLKMEPNYAYSGDWRLGQGTGAMCKTFQKFKKGDIINLAVTRGFSNSPSQANGLFDKNFKFVIQSVSCNHLALDLVSQDPGGYLYLLGPEEYVDLTMVRPNVSNNSTKSIGNVLTYDSRVNSSNEIYRPEGIIKTDRQLNHYTPSSTFSQYNYQDNDWLETRGLLEYFNNSITSIMNGWSANNDIVNFGHSPFDTREEYFNKVNFANLSNPSNNQSPIITGIPCGPSSTFFRYLDLDGNCKTEALNDNNIKISGRIYDFDNWNGIAQLKYDYSSTATKEYKVKLLVIEIAKQITNSSSNGFENKQRFWSFVAKPTDNIGIEYLPSFWTHNDNEISFSGEYVLNQLRDNNWNWDCSKIYPFNSTACNLNDIAGPLGNFNSWCSNFGVFKSCNKVYFDQYIDAKNVISSKFIELGNNIQISNRYIDGLIEKPLTGVYKYKESTLANIQPTISFNTDYSQTIANCNENIYRKINYQNPIIHPKSTYVFDNKMIDFDNTSSAKYDLTQNSINNTNPNSNVMTTPSPTYSFYKDGTMNNQFRLFNWSNIDRNVNWVETERYNISKNGKVNSILNQFDNTVGSRYDQFLGEIKTMGINNTNPKLSFFEDCENYDFALLHYSRIDEHSFIDPLKNKPHTGSISATLSNCINMNTFPADGEGWISTSFIEGADFIYNPEQEDYKVSLWLSSSTYNIPNEDNKVKAYLMEISKSSLTFNPYKQTTDMSIGAHYNPVNMIELQKILQVGEWMLYEGVIKKASIVDFANTKPYYSWNLSVFKMGIKASKENFSGYFNIDDIKFTPISSEVNCIVTDWNDGFKVKAILDNNHMPSEFIYNEYNELVKKIVTTTKGKKTISDFNRSLPNSYR
jgi:hypothetical protein